MSDFIEDLKRSRLRSLSPAWPKILSSLFTFYQSTEVFPQDGEHQRAGIDRAVIMSNAECIFIDEKIREKAYPDIAVEFVSNTVTGAPGWACKSLRAHYIAYLMLESGQGYLLPVHPLQTAWRRHGGDWRAAYGEIAAHNAGYNTLFCPVPVDVLYPAMGRTLRFTFDPADFGEDPIPF